MARNIDKPDKRVFLNVPYDPAFSSLFLAYICGLSAFGLTPKLTLEIQGGACRLDRIVDLIKGCRYAVHDLSWVLPDKVPPANASIQHAVRARPVGNAFNARP